MNQELLNKVESGQLRKEPLEFAVGDSVMVHTRVVEGDKERIQVFAGLVIGRRGHGVNEMKANNVLFFDLKNVPSGTQRAPTAIAPATQLEAVT